MASDQRVFEGPENDVAGAGADCGLSVGEGCEPSVGRGRPQGRNAVGSARRLPVYRQVKLMGKNIVNRRVSTFFFQSLVAEPEFRKS